MSAASFILWMIPWLFLAGIIVWIGYLAYAASLAKKEAAAFADERAHEPDLVLELERTNTELARAATNARQTLEATRETVRKGTR